MKIKRLDIIGFKSFVERTSVDFQQGFTGIVGPNGCGKSNIVDAIRWVMGEQSVKNLRGRAMEDVIFAGSEKRNPSGRAEVSLTLENDDGLAPAVYRDFAEITVTRRLYRNGDSEYLLNKVPCRLLDITELFMDTGAGTRAYSVIEQGKIGTILNAKPEERRALIEEAAGVTKFKARRKAAQRKMDATRQNLVRLNDVVSEVRRQMNSLKRQAQRAEQYRDLKKQARTLDLGLAAENFDRLATQLDRIEADGRQSRQMLEEATAQLKQHEVKLEEARLVQATREKDYNDGQQRVLHLSGQIQRNEGNLALGEKEKQSLLRQKERHRNEKTEAVERLNEMAEERVSLNRLAKGIAAELANEEALLQTQQADLDRLTEQEQSLAKELDGAREAMMAVVREQSRLQQRAQDVRARLAAVAERQSRCGADRVALSERHDDVASQQQQVEERLEVAKEQQQHVADEADQQQVALSALREEQEKKAQALQKIRDHYSHCRSRVESLRELQHAGEGLDDGLRSQLDKPTFKEQVVTSLADSIQVPESIEVAVGAALGDRLQALIAKDDAVAQQLIDTLETEGGFGRFLVKVPPVEPMATPRGAEPLAQRVDIAPDRVDRVAPLLAGVFLVERLEPYLQQSLPAGALLVTPAGRVLRAGGELSGGQAMGVGVGLLQKKRELAEREKQCNALEESLKRKETEQQQGKDTIDQAEEDLSLLQSRLQQHQQTVVEIEKNQARLHHERQQLRERIDLLIAEQKSLQGQEDALKEEGHALEHERLEEVSQQQQRQEAYERLQEQQPVLRRELEGLRTQVTSHRVEVAGLKERLQNTQRNLEQLDRQREALQQRQRDLDQQLTLGDEEVEGIDQRKNRLRAELEALLQKRHQEQERCEALRHQFEDHQFVLEEQQDAYRCARDRTEALRERVGALQLQEKECALEKEHVRQSVQERHRVDLARQSWTPDKEWDAEQARQRLTDLRNRIDRLGEVNLMAIDEYKELEERYTFLTDQQSDLQQSLDELQKAIARINRTTRERFKDTFERVNEHFRQVFPRLFCGGRAALALTDENDLLETGIEIVAQPPGKRLQDVNLLSGGEKALTAVALIFSLFLVKPSPFCLLDEVDAPLDDANIGRFTEMIAEMAQQTQFVVITHNKKTMEGADVMYGVTMEEPGVSKMVSVRMNAA